MIVDDEWLTRMAISSMLANYPAEFTLIAEVDNVNDAICIAEKMEPDIIITDVKMPVATGIDLIRLAREKGIIAKFIILSAYSEFEYVREGMRLGAEDYLLKLEIEEKKLIQLLRNISSKIKETNNKSEGEENTDSKPVNPNEHLLQLLTDTGISIKELEIKLKSFIPSAGKNNLTCILIQKSKEENVENIDLLNMFSFLESFLKNYGIVYGCMINPELFCFLIVLKDSVETKNINVLKKSIYDYIKSLLGVSLRILISQTFNCIENVVQFFNKHCIYENGSYILTDVSEDLESVATKSLLEDELSYIMKALDTRKTDELTKAFDSLCKCIKNNHSISYEDLHGICYTLIHFTDRFNENNHYDNFEWNRSHAFMKLIKSCVSTEDYINFINYIRDKLVSALPSSFVPDVIIKAKKYISENFREDISLSQVAKAVNLNPSYFSRLFSDEVGTSFTNYLNTLRIEYSKDLIAYTDESIQDIAYKVGYNSAYYFIKKFKRVTSMTPTKYRVHIRNS